MLAVVDHRIPDLAAQALESRGFSLLRLPPHPNLDPPIASHPDMLLFFAPDAVFCTEEYYAAARRELDALTSQTGLLLRRLPHRIHSPYPQDILLNAAPVGRHLFCLFKHTAAALRTHPAYQTVNVRQGYAKCSVIPVGEHALITADPSIARAAEAEHLDVLQICGGHVALNGYGYGFLGGCTSYSPYRDFDTLLFCGDLDQHPNAKEIRQFCNAHQKQTVSLSNEPLYDVGTIFLI